MQVSPVPELREDFHGWLEKAHAPYQIERDSDGHWHVANLVGQIEVMLEMKKHRDGGDEAMQEARQQFEKGYAWEHVLDAYFRTRMWELGYPKRPDTIFEDGIAGSPDGHRVIDWSVHEYKSTVKSARRIGDGSSVRRWEENFWGWITQMKAYCHMLGATEAYLWVWWMAGDYAPPFPDVMPYHFTFTEIEIDETWRMLTNRARANEKAGLIPGGKA